MKITEIGIRDGCACAPTTPALGAVRDRDELTEYVEFFPSGGVRGSVVIFCFSCLVTAAAWSDQHPEERFSRRGRERTGSSGMVPS